MVRYGVRAMGVSIPPIWTVFRAIGDERRRQQAAKKEVRIAQAISDRAAG